EPIYGQPYQREHFNIVSVHLWLQLIALKSPSKEKADMEHSLIRQKMRLLRRPNWSSIYSKLSAGGSIPLIQPLSQLDHVYQRMLSMSSLIKQKVFELNVALMIRRVV